MNLYFKNKNNPNHLYKQDEENNVSHINIECKLCNTIPEEALIFLYHKNKIAFIEEEEWELELSKTLVK